MTKQESITTAAVVGASIFTGLDGDALMGAFAGGSLYAMKSKEVSRTKRVGYMAISIVAGYYFRNELDRLGITSTAVTAFIVATFAIALVSWGYDQIGTLSIKDLWGKRND